MPFTYGTPLMGFEGKFYVGPAGSTSPANMTLADTVRNPKYSYKFSDVDATLRRHMGIKAYIKGMLDVTVSFTLPIMINESSASHALITNALKSRRMPIAICMISDEDGEGIIGDFEVFGGDKSEEDENLQEFEVECKPSAAGRPVSWYQNS